MWWRTSNCRSLLIYRQGRTSLQAVHVNELQYHLLPNRTANIAREIPFHDVSKSHRKSSMSCSRPPFRSNRCPTYTVKINDIHLLISLRLMTHEISIADFCCTTEVRTDHQSALGLVFSTIYCAIENFLVHTFVVQHVIRSAIICNRNRSNKVVQQQLAAKSRLSPA